MEKMKKIYIFLNRRICGIDGSIQYIYNKSHYLEKTDYEVLVFSVKDGEILVKEFEKYKKYIISEMRFCPSIFQKTEREAIVKKAIEKIQDHKQSEIIIESTSPVSAIWGELMANKLKCKHVFFHLMERTNLQEDFRAFCRFKYQRGELAGITPQTVPYLLADSTVKPATITAFLGNVFAECEEHFSDILEKKDTITIGSIGRLEKAYVLHTMNEILEYCRNNQGKRYNLVLIGGGPNEKTAKRISEIAQDCHNVTLLFTGSLYPIPISLINNIDLFISTAGAANGTYKQKKPTIEVHPISGEALGIIGCDFSPGEKTMFETDGRHTISDCIDRIVNHKATIVYNTVSEDIYNNAMEAEFKRQLEIAYSNSAQEYYDKGKLYEIKTPFKRHHNLYACVCHITGGKLFQRLLKVCQKD